MINGKKVLAFIPAKTGSVGLPGKLFKEIGNKSLLHWTLEAAKRSNYIDEIVTSSNDPEIKKQIEAFNGGPRFKFLQRPDNLCTATSKTELAIQHLLGHYKNCDYIVMLQATSPARRGNLIDNCLEKFDNGNYDSLITVKKITPFFWRKNSEMDCTYPIYSLKNRPMRQEMSEDDYFYHDNGNIYITKKSLFLKSKLRVSGNTFLYETPEFESIQVDNPDDFAIISKMFEHYGNFL